MLKKIFKKKKFENIRKWNENFLNKIKSLLKLKKIKKKYFSYNDVFKIEKLIDRTDIYSWKEWISLLDVAKIIIDNGEKCPVENITTITNAKNIYNFFDWYYSKILLTKYTSGLYNNFSSFNSIKNVIKEIEKIKKTIFQIILKIFIIIFIFILFWLFYQSYNIFAKSNPIVYENIKKQYKNEFIQKKIVEKIEKEYWKYKKQELVKYLTYIIMLILFWIWYVNFKKHNIFIWSKYYKHILFNLLLISNINNLSKRIWNKLEIEYFNAKQEIKDVADSLYRDRLITNMEYNIIINDLLGKNFLYKTRLPKHFQKDLTNLRKKQLLGEKIWFDWLFHQIISELFISIYDILEKFKDIETKYKIFYSWILWIAQIVSMWILVWITKTIVWF